MKQNMLSRPLRARRSSPSLTIGLALLLSSATLLHAGSIERLSLEQALQTAEASQPELAAAQAAVQAASGRAEQAGSFPNPEAILGAQQLPLRDHASNQKEFVAGLGQTIPLSSRLGKARDAERLDREVRLRGLEVKRQEIRRNVHRAFATALYQERASDLQATLCNLAQKALPTTAARLENGDASREDLIRVELELARARLEVTRAQALRDQARLALASSMGDVRLDIKSLDGVPESAFAIPALESLAANLSDRPEIALANAEVRANQSRVSLAEVERIPDIKFEILYHRLEGPRENTLDLGLSIPLPLFNRNQGRLREAKAEVAAAEARARHAENQLQSQLQSSHLLLTSALANARTLKDEILVKAETMLKATEARYAAGDASLTEALAARRDWAALQLTHLESLGDVMQAWSNLAPFLGQYQ